MWHRGDLRINRQNLHTLPPNRENTPNLQELMPTAMKMAMSKAMEVTLVSIIPIATGQLKILAMTNKTGQTHPRSTRGTMDIMLIGASTIIPLVGWTSIGAQKPQIG